MKGKLKGENRIELFRKAAENLVSNISSLEGVTGIIVIGGVVRGFVDRISDVDITVFLDRRDRNLRVQIRKISLEEERRSKIEADLEIHFLEDFEEREWDEAQKWEFSRAEIRYDPEGKVKKVFEKKLRPPEEFWVERIVVWTEYLTWYCCPPREDVGTVSGAWIERGDMTSAHYCVTYAVDVLINMLYALNREFLPAPKWRLFYSHELRWLPKGYSRLIEQAMITRSFSVKEFNRRLTAVRQLWREVLPKIEDETGFTLEQITQYFVEKVLHQPDVFTTPDSSAGERVDWSR